jgi:hypothetical protein
VRLRRRPSTVGLLPFSLYIPPPPYWAKFPEKVTFASVELLPIMNIPPPLLDAELPKKVTFVSVGLPLEL